MNFEQRVSEAKLNKTGDLMVRTVKIGNRLLGTIETPKAKPGVPQAGATYWTTSEVVRVSSAGKFLTISRARIANLGMYGVKKLGLRCLDGTVYCIAIDTLQDWTVGVKPAAYVCVPASAWEVELPPEEVRVHNTMEKMRVGRRKSSVTGV